MKFNWSTGIQAVVVKVLNKIFIFLFYFFYFFQLLIKQVLKIKLIYLL